MASLRGPECPDDQCLTIAESSTSSSSFKFQDSSSSRTAYITDLGSEDMLRKSNVNIQARMVYEREARCCVRTPSKVEMTALINHRGVFRATAVYAPIYSPLGSTLLQVCDICASIYMHPRSSIMAQKNDQAEPMMEGFCPIVDLHSIYHVIHASSN